MNTTYRNNLEVIKTYLINNDKVAPDLAEEIAAEYYEMFMEYVPGVEEEF